MELLFPHKQNPILSRKQWETYLGWHTAGLMSGGVILLWLSAPGWWLACLDLLFGLFEVDIRLSRTHDYLPWLGNLFSHSDPLLEKWVAFCASITAIAILGDTAFIDRLRQRYPSSPLRQRLPLRRWIFAHYVYFLAAMSFMGMMPVFFIAAWSAVTTTITAQAPWQIAAAWVTPGTGTFSPLLHLVVIVTLLLLVSLTARCRSQLKHI